MEAGRLWTRIGEGLAWVAGGGEKGERVLVLGEVLGRGRDGRSPVFHVPRGYNGELGGFLREMCKEEEEEGEGVDATGVNFECAGVRSDWGWRWGWESLCVL